MNFIRISMLLATLLCLVVLSAAAQVKSEIEAATKAGNAVVLVVTDGTTGLSSAKGIAERVKANTPKVRAVLMDRKDKANAALVRKYGLKGVQAPFLLVIAPTGAAVDGMPAGEATPEGVAALIPSPRQAEMFKAFDDGKAVFLVAGKTGFTDLASGMDKCRTACTKMKKKAVTVFVDLDDKREQKFLSLLSVDKNAGRTQVHVFNKTGNLVSKMSEPLAVPDLVKAAGTKTKAPCCPGGSGPGCK